MKTYTIGSKTYVQRPLVLGQVKQLMDIIRGVVIPQVITIPALIDMFGDRLSLALAVVITEEGKPVKDKDIEMAAMEIEYEIMPEQILEIIDDFFFINQIALLFQRVITVIKGIQDRMTGLSRCASSSVKETSPGGMPSSGDILSGNASHTSNTVSAM
ncbi:MAG: hypothetical protein DWB56_06715 [Candidatus Jettenia sp.]|uniref:Uncharacterized protein n=1 Tax=Candidatus Jettenia caeni TaxID=247490 RepID=I3IN10_9BACT|nr:hypothetical protein [Candidatus Jettenia sp. AMX1]MBC6928645.1 hypothetical protein [Candidatus Jettenia sp.]GAB63105.1 hypothetical protein KSU1_C1509 [Candidatus Jettenia caeni]KAA0250623.1 MAG: hypothetical protein EDM77_03655 [Candidatus Jettenia sp. AMX1]MCE7879957.1 hypothetical protein [Candidatus Jettenia sp. AMX1]MCQ3926739.1 hypothetical protein [Candidatus Jettenia sp.]